MSYEKITFVDRIAEYPTRRKLTTTDTQQTFGTYDVSRDEGTVSQEGTALNAATFNALQANVESAFVEVDNNIASAYDATSTYAEGDFCIYDGVLYQANQDIETAEAWDSTHWDSVKLTDIMGTGSASIDDTVVASDKTWSSEHIASFLPEDSASGAIASFSDGANAIPCPSVLCTINPVQSGSGDPSPSNVRPITGHTELNLVHTGANIWDEEWESGSIIPSTGEDVANANKIRCVGRIPVKPNTSYVIVFSGVTSGSDYIYYYKKDGTFISSDSYVHTANGTQVFTTPSDCYGLRFIMSQTAYNNNISVNYPSTDTNYHAYTGTTTTTDLGTTVYGGTLDPVSGVLTIDRVIYTFDGTESAIAYGSGWRYVVLTGKEAKSYSGVEIPNLISNQYVAINRNQISSGVEGASVTGDTILLSTDTPTGVQVCYELATPITTQLTPQEVKSLLGSNNIYHDCNGQVAVTYRADIGLYIDKKTS